MFNNKDPWQEMLSKSKAPSEWYAEDPEDTLNEFLTIEEIIMQSAPRTGRRQQYPPHVQRIIDKWTGEEFPARDGNKAGPMTIANRDVAVLVSEIDRLRQENEVLKSRIGFAAEAARPPEAL